MKRCPALIAALPREVSALVKGWERRELAGGVLLYSNGDAVVACAGMGAKRVALAVRTAVEVMQVGSLISVGLAGACDPALRVGDVVLAAKVIDGATGERFGDMDSRDVLVTMDRIASVAEKARLFAEHGAAAVDMEAAAVARLARMYGVEFKAIKAISDEADFEVGSLSRFATAEGQFREGAFAVHAALRPWMWGKVIALGKNSGKALAALTEAMKRELDWYEKEVS